MTDLPEKFKIGVINTNFFSYLIQIVDYESQDIIKKVIFDRYSGEITLPQTTRDYESFLEHDQNECLVEDIADSYRVHREI